MLVHRLDRVLARTDPFDLAQSLERYVQGMPADRIRALVLDARHRMGDYYRAEFVRLLREEESAPRFTAKELNSKEFAQIVRDKHTPQALQRALARLLKSNLRAIPIFGSAFSEAVLEDVPSDRAVALGEESTNAGMRAMVFGGLAVALVVAGAAGEHFIMNVRAQTAASPLPVLSAPIAISVTRPKVTRTPAPPTAPPPTAPPRTPAPPTPVATSIVPPVVAPAPTPERTKPPRAQPSPPPARGVATIAIPTPTAAPTMDPSDLDTSDMPDAFTDATPLPPQTAPPAEAPHRVILNTPTPKPGPRGWIKRSLIHLDPFKSRKP